MKNSQNIKSRHFCIFGVILLSLFLMGPTAYSAPMRGGTPGAPGVDGAPPSSKITLDFKDADINTVLRVMSLKSGINIVAGPEVQGTVTIRLENVPWEKALEVVLRTYGYVYERNDNIIRVTTRENLAAEPVVTQTYILNYTKATEIQTAVQDMLTERGRIKTAERTNTIVITDIPTNLFRIGEIILKLDRMTPQAFIDSKVIKTDAGLTENLGIEWQTGGANNNVASLSGSSRPTTFPFVTSAKDGGERLPPFLEEFFPVAATTTTAVQNPATPRSFPLDLSEVNPTYTLGTLNFSSFNSILQLLKTASSTKVVSNPRVVVLNNQTAKVQVGTDVPLPTFERNETTGSVEVTGFTYRETGVVLNVTPHINSEEEILVDLQPEVSSQGANVNFGDFQVPSFNVTKAVTQVLIRSGETIAIGGLLTDNVTTTEARVPYLSDIPLIGKIFRSKRQDTTAGANNKIETLFFVTVTMVDTEGQPTGERIDEEEASRNNALEQALEEQVETPAVTATQSDSTEEEFVGLTDTEILDTSSVPISDSDISTEEPLAA